MQSIRNLAIIMTLGFLSACTSSSTNWDSAYSGVAVGQVIDMEAD